MAGEIGEIHFFSKDFDEFFVKFSEPVGKGEIFVNTEDILPIGSEVELLFHVVYEDLPFFRASGTVTAVIEPDQSSSGSGKAPGMTVKINDIDEQIKGFIVSLVKSQIKSELSRMFTT